MSENANVEFILEDRAIVIARRSLDDHINVVLALLVYNACKYVVWLEDTNLEPTIYFNGRYYLSHEFKSAIANYFNRK